MERAVIRENRIRRACIGTIPDDWNIVSIAEVVDRKPNAIVGGPFGSDLVSTDYVPSGIPVIRGTNMATPVVSGDFVFISTEKGKSLSANMASPGDIVFTQRGTLGQVSVVPNGPFGKYLISQSQMKLSVNDAAVHKSYLLHYFASFAGQKQILDSAIQTGVPHTNLNILRNYTFPLPAMREQEAIAETLSDADALIEGLKRLVAKKRLIKQGAMHDLLAAKRRLPGFSGKWVERKLGALLTVRHGRSQKEVETPSGRYPILATGGQIGTANSFLWNKPSVLIGRKGTIDRPQFMEMPFWTVDTLFYTDIQTPNDPRFLFYVFQRIEWQSYNEASGVPSLNAKTIENIDVVVPDAAEQVAISGVLKDMDAEIQALETRLDKARQVKEGMMQNLLTGRIRLV
jgi:type I restriction enzyme S subunit